MKTLIKNLLGFLLKLCLIAVVGTALLFVVYFFNLDMKATAMLEPFFEKWYDKLERKQYI